MFHSQSTFENKTVKWKQSDLF
uniref:Uncharacterized protein n=1 Tax=Anguilla anguilla TaxID=7936 RepID=A0A0E9Q4R0_ANGAN